MQVIDLVNKIYNNEIRDNTKIKFINEPSATIWEYKTNFNTLSCGIMNKDLLMCLNDEIEIIEEDETIEKIVGLHHPSTKSLDLIKEDIELAFETIDKLIDKVNELKRRMNNDC